MSPPLKYPPAYVGLYVSLVLAVTCNAFLDIQYGVFGTEVLIWTVVFFITLWVGWQQRGQITPWGRAWQKWVMVIAVILSVVIFLPMWGLPRAGVYMLAAFQASYNCVTTTRRHLYFGLLVAVVMVIFSASHFRADWTMLFYLIPFMVTVVFTLVADQINHRMEGLRAQSLGKQVVGGQGLAIAAASLIILLLAAVFYVLTPHATWNELSWRYGVAGGTGPDEQSRKIGVTGGEAGVGDVFPLGDGGTGGAGGSMAEGKNQGSGLTPGEMRQSASRQGMPRWQSAVINAMADFSEALDKQLVPLKSAIKDLRKALKQWQQEHKQDLFYTIIALMLLALLVALWRLLREARIGIWIATRADYLRYAILGQHARGTVGAIQLYRAMERLFALLDQPRQGAFSAREYLLQLRRLYPDLRLELVEMTMLFEEARYGSIVPSEKQLSRMCKLYRHLFEKSF